MLGTKQHLLLALATLVTQVVGDAVSVSPSATSPSGAVKVDPSFPNFAFEFSSMIDYAQSESILCIQDDLPLIGKFSQPMSTIQPPINTLSTCSNLSLVEREECPSFVSGETLGELSRIASETRSLGLRLGLTTTMTHRDHAQFNASQTVPIKPRPTFGGKSPGQPTWGPSFYSACKQLSDSSAAAKFLIQISLSTNDMAYVKNWASVVSSNLGNDNVYVWEIGNEPDQYGHNFTAME